MRVLLIEDDENKRAHVKAYIAQAFPQLELSEAVSLIGSLRIARETKPDLIILDMALPTYDESSSSANADMHHFGGEEFLRQAIRLRITSKVIVVSQFETFGTPPNTKSFSTLSAELESRFGGIYMGSVYYHASIFDWMDELGQLIKQAQAERKI